MFAPVFSDPPLLLLCLIHLLIEQSLEGKLHMLSLVFFFLGRVHVISTGPIHAVQTEDRGFASS
ncbi:unnamed protein product [Staurois parvus]|uniref:Secreted protein n=1 Tax=Staurois parvus TaxID=386267 RepID=A0ABN9CK55_9NEOB|nr:unnamed protein product [Staurois parvus]